MHYVRIPTDILLENAQFSFSIFVKVNEQYAAFIPKGIPITKDKREKLENQKLYVQECDLFTYQDAYKAYLSRLDDQHRTVHIKTQAFSTIENIFTSSDLKSAIKDAQPVMAYLVDYVASSPSAVSNLLQLSSHSYYTYNHSVNVTTYTLSLCMRLFKDITKKELESIALGGFLHDIGKKNIPANIINKPSKLTDEEWSIVKKHPEWGYEMIKSEPFCDEIVSAIILQHHENFNGSGYPKGLKMDEIHPYAQVCAIGDSFDAMTNKRPYADALKADQAMQQLQRGRGIRYNPKFLNIFSTRGDYTTE